MWWVEKGCYLVGFGVLNNLSFYMKYFANQLRISSFVVGGTGSE